MNTEQDTPIIATIETVEALPPPKQKRGFALLDSARVRELASKGGKSAHASGVAHQFNHEEAVAAGSKGGKAPHRKRGK